jgi:pilus assembly protein TadC
MKLLYAEEFGKAFTPRGVRSELKRYLFKAGITKEPFAFFGILFYCAIGVSVVIFFSFFYSMVRGFVEPMPDLQRVAEQVLITFGIVAGLMFSFLGLIIVTIYAYLDMRIFNRTRKLEEILPEFLEMVSSNLKGGMSFEKSLWMAIKPKFGILANEIALAAKKVMTGHDVDIALTEFSLKYDSPMLKRSMNLIISQIQSGGEIADIIDRIVVDLKKTKALKDEMSASVLSYMIFISAIVVFISPVLFALSYALLTVIQSITSLLGASMSNVNIGLPFEMGNSSIDPAMFVWPFSYCAIGITAIGASMIVSIIEKGTIRGGVKYIPMFLVSAVFIYFVAQKVMGFLVSMIKI